MKRLEDWELRLHDFIVKRAGLPFIWGENDCALFVTDGIEAMTGQDVGGDFRGQYSTLASAVVRMQKVAGGPSVENVAEHVAAEHQLAELSNILFSQRGDVVLFDGSEGPAIGLVSLDGIHAVFVGSEGLRRIPISDCRRAWRI